MPETTKVPTLDAQAIPGIERTRRAATLAFGIAAVADAIRRAAGILAAWLTGLPRRAGRHLFAMNDLEATWRHWQVIELAGGLGRQYRDARFDLGPEARALDETSASPRPPVPEAWDDHWNGCPLNGDG